MSSAVNSQEEPGAREIHVKRKVRVLPLLFLFVQGTSFRNKDGNKFFCDIANAASALEKRVNLTLTTSGDLGTSIRISGSYTAHAIYPTPPCSSHPPITHPNPPTRFMRILSPPLRPLQATRQAWSGH